MNNPLVSVVIPFYAGKKWLVEAINSAISQRYTNIEILVINDGSPEDISDLKMIFNNKVNIINKENGGPASARNFGIELSKGKYIAFLDSDDIWLPNKLMEQINFMEQNNSQWSQHSYEMFWENAERKKIVDTSFFFGDVLKDTYISFKIQTSCVVVLREILINNDIRFPIEKRFGEDNDFYRQLAKNFSLSYVEGIYSMFRIRGKNAGFRATVQLNDKATTWREIKDNEQILDLLPKGIIFAYKLSDELYVRFQKNNSIFLENGEKKELYARILYSFPYFIFKYHAIKNKGAK
jgi:glycosyltransferase involved in cell wall biosynthesis